MTPFSHPVELTLVAHKGPRETNYAIYDSTNATLCSTDRRGARGDIRFLDGENYCYASMTLTYNSPSTVRFGAGESMLVKNWLRNDGSCVLQRDLLRSESPHPTSDRQDQKLEVHL